MKICGLENLKNSNINMRSIAPSAISDLSDLDQHRFAEFGFGELVEPAYRMIHHAFEDHVNLRPEAIAAVHLGESITYAELNRRAEELAAHLMQLGVGPGDHVGLFIRRSLPMLVGILGVLKAGAAYVPQDVKVAPRAQLQHVMREAQVRVVLTLREFEELIPCAENTTVINLDENICDSIFLAPPIGLDRKTIAPERTCFVLFTSGTTGKPNGVQVSHKNICNILLTEPGSLGMRPGQRVSQILNIAFDMAAWEILGCLSHGATLVIRGKSIEETVQDVDVVIATPSILATIDVEKCLAVKCVAVAGEPCPRQLADKWSRIANFYNSCGPTEVTIVNTMQLHHAGKEKLSIGRPTPNNTVYILDADMNPCPIGEIGEMWAGGDCVSLGYVNNEQLNLERYRPDPFLGGERMMFRTRDLGRWTVDGELEHFGRTDDQVKVRGFRVELDSVSAVLESVPGCEQAVTLKLDDRNLVAFVRPASVNIDEAKLALEKMLPYYCVPELIIPIKEFPKTERGKIDKHSLTVRAVQKQEMVASQKSLPPPKGLWPKISKHPLLMPYNRLAVFATLANLFAFALLKNGSALEGADGLRLVLNFVLVNFAIAILIRQQYVINLLFKIATSAPITWPLQVRWALGKVYHFGGIHVGCFFSGTLWYFLFAIAYLNTSMPTVLLIFHLLVLTAMMVVALPKFRARFHNQFEVVARFGVWISLILFWVQALLFPLNGSDVDIFSVCILALLTFSVALPWMRLRKVNVTYDRPSSHAVIAKFDYGVTPFAGSSTELSRSPWLEWHSFANVPIPNEDGFRLTISRAGDWTGQLIDDLPSQIWVKGIPTAGVGNIESLFKKVVWVATGSGIGPCLPHLFSKKVPATLVWSTKNPERTFGKELVKKIKAAQPEALIWDTDQNGKPDLVALAYSAYKNCGAEAVICISNKKVTWNVVHELESRGVPAFGAIWDS